MHGCMSPCMTLHEYMYNAHSNVLWTQAHDLDVEQLGRSRGSCSKQASPWKYSTMLAA